MFNLPDTPVNSVIAGATIGVLTVTAYFAKKKSEDQQHLVNTHLEMKRVDAEQQANMLTILKEMTSKTLV